MRELALAQEALQANAVETVGTLNTARVLQRALGLVAESMRLAADGLSGQDAGDSTQDAERRALARLEQLREALQPEPPQPNEKPPTENSNSANPPGNQQQKPPGEAQRRLAELKMLKLLQVEVYDGTKALEERRRRMGALTPQEQLLLEQLSAEQGKLAEMLSELNQAANEAGAPPEGDE